jgi:thioredoxin 1
LTLKVFFKKDMSKKQQTSFRDLVNGDTPVLIDFFATWCGPCHAYSPILQQLKSERGDDLRLVKIDVDQNEAICQKLGVTAMPTTMIFQRGELKFRAAGVQSIGTLKAELDKLRV